jgi:hypothetical protein
VNPYRDPPFVFVVPPLTKDTPLYDSIFRPRVVGIRRCAFCLRPLIVESIVFEDRDEDGWLCSINCADVFRNGSLGGRVRVKVHEARW